ncbi:U3 small nucleolar RNA-associated protein 25 homolog [Symsagittifera roscoffensis]|uniref:U3 small nucleolar RNA-associated protein 25 homolog n=1 Tax=Symsagittifera roscoffensis TaxID=84072 RepID=UPI00307C4B80
MLISASGKRKKNPDEDSAKKQKIDKTSTVEDDVADIDKNEADCLAELRSREIYKEDALYRKFFRGSLTAFETDQVKTVSNKAVINGDEDHQKKNFNSQSLLPRLKKMFTGNFGDLTGLQNRIMKVLVDYSDFRSSLITSNNLQEIQRVVSLHILNHVLKSRTIVLQNNRELKRASEQQIEYQPDDYRDQCITRPSCLILTPFRNSAYNIIKVFFRLFEDSKKHKITKKKRFEIDYGPDGHEPISEYRAQDYLDMMYGNTDEDFKFGLSVSPVQIRLYSHFYRSDIIVASPLGLFQIVGDIKDKHGDKDFLSSIQVLYLDQADVLMMQNWSHVISIFEIINKKPTEAHEANFARVHEWCLDEQMKYFRQNIITSRFKAPEFNSISSKFCHNISGIVEEKISNVGKGQLNRVVSQIVHVFRRFAASSCSEQDNERFGFFCNHILKEFRELHKCKIVIYIPDYYDFVKVRNHLRRNKYDFVPISEYDTYKKARDRMKKFRKGEVKFLLMTERFHFYNRLFFKGIERLFFYQLPRYDHFYSELCNMIGIGANSDSVELSCSTIFCQYDALRLLPIVNEENCKKLINSSNLTHMFITGGN